MILNLSNCQIEIVTQKNTLETIYYLRIREEVL